MQLSSFSKIFQLGSRPLATLFYGPVEVTEKVDGSQFGFGKINGELIARSKGKMIIFDACDSMFSQAITQVQRVADQLPDNTLFWAEYLNKPKHNVLAYERVPKNNLMLFGMCGEEGTNWHYDYDNLTDWAGILEFDVARLLHYGEINSADEIKELMDTDSFLGNVKIEGMVIKNWAQDVMIGGQYVYPLCGKYVSDRFKEKMGAQKNKFSVRGRWEDYKQAFRTEARWHKAIQHLREDGALLDEPKDIGPLIKEINKDIVIEHKDEILAFLWSQFGKEILRTSIAGFPEFYKVWLLDKSFTLEPDKEEPVTGYTKESWNEMEAQAESTADFIEATKKEK